jgi:FtsH-binding integral membrane protein
MTQAWNQNSYSNWTPAAQAVADERTSFIRRTYGHLFMALAALCALDYAILNSEVGVRMATWMMSGRSNWLIVLVAFMGVSWLANRFAQSNTSKGLQYAGLIGYTVAEAVILAPLLLIAARFGGPNVIQQAAISTLLVFGGLSMYVLISKRDFSFLRPALTIAGFAAIGIIVLSMLVGFSLGIFFMGAMVAFAAAYILYDTSNVMKHYRTDQHVAASLALFASVALMFWYMLQLLMSLSGRD